MNKHSKQYMPNNQKGIAHYLLILIVVVGIAVGIYLIQNTQVFSPKAQESAGISYEEHLVVTGKAFALKRPSVACTLMGGPNEPRVTLGWTAATPGSQSVASPTYTILFRDNKGGRETRAGTTKNTTFELNSTHGLVKGRSYGFIVTAPGARGGTVFSDNSWSDKLFGFTLFNCDGATTTPSGTPTVAPASPRPPASVVTEPGQGQILVTRLSKPITGNIADYFYTSKENEIRFLISRGYTKQPALFSGPSSKEAGAVMAKRLRKVAGYGNLVEITWAADPADIARLKAQDFTEFAETDFYVFLTQKPGTVPINRIKVTYGSGIIRSNYNFIKAGQAIPRDWTLDKANAFYAYP